MLIKEGKTEIRVLKLVLKKAFLRDSKHAQLTVFIIIAMLFVGAAAGFFIFRGYLKSDTGIPASIEPVYANFLSCLEEEIRTGIAILESQAGYIELPDFEPGSPYMPFSSQLDFLGNPIPYWYYVSGNNVQKEQIPSKKDMENQMERFIENKIAGCRFDSYYEAGFEILQGEPKAEIKIGDDEVRVKLDMDFTVSNEDETASVSVHEVSVRSDLGRLYKAAREVYEAEQKTLFLENYSVDVLRLYAPVDGVEISCSPKTWIADEVFDQLGEAIEANTLALKSSGKKNDYFAVDALKGIDSGVEVRFLNSRKWPSSFEVSPSEGNVLIASPVGNQEGVGAMGFCYVPYHFVYNIRYPVLIQVYSGNGEEQEIFQFPVAVVIQGNKPRKALDATAAEVETPDLCKYKNTLVEINAYDTRLNPLEAEISYECLGVRCDIGKTSLTKPLSEEFPQCVNGYVIAKAEGFEDSKQMYSTTESGSVDIILDRLYEKEIEIKVDGKPYGKGAVVSFISDTSTKTLLYPEQKRINLSEGQYEIQVYIYRNSSLRLESSTKEQCIDVPQTGIKGVFGMTKEKCFNIEIPSQIISNALSGGGKERYYILEDELESSGKIEINAESLPLPRTIEQLQENYMLFESKGLDIYFR